MTNLPERKPCINCEGLTRMTLDNGTPLCQRCCDKRNAIAQEARKMCKVYGCTKEAYGNWEWLCYEHSHE